MSDGSFMVYGFGRGRWGEGEILPFLLYTSHIKEYDELVIL
jgi:hypothetical protein